MSKNAKPRDVVGEETEFTMEPSAEAIAEHGAVSSAAAAGRRLIVLTGAGSYTSGSLHFRAKGESQWVDEATAEKLTRTGRFRGAADVLRR
ncbi:MAG: hypothetical protein LBC93_06910 [Synergistaceae bacterium]|jgi:hypothetical protein|nr:hypothetical protein [Synergistaceae bacterium]